MKQRGVAGIISGIAVLLVVITAALSSSPAFAEQAKVFSAAAYLPDSDLTIEGAADATALPRTSSLTDSAAIMVDGDPTDWVGITPLVEESPETPDWMDITRFYATKDASNLYFRVDLAQDLPGDGMESGFGGRLYIDTDDDLHTDYYLHFDYWCTPAGTHTWVDLYVTTDGVPGERIDSPFYLDIAVGVGLVELGVSLVDLDNPMQLGFRLEGYTFAEDQDDRPWPRHCVYSIGSRTRFIVVDGNPNDWGNSTREIADSEGDADPSYYDMTGVFIADNGARLYLRIDTAATPWLQVPSSLYRRWEVLFEFGVGSELYPLVYIHDFCYGSESWYYWWPGRGEITPVNSCSAAVQSVFEFGIPLSEFGISGGDSLDLTFIETTTNINDRLPDQGWVAFTAGDDKPEASFSLSDPSEPLHPVIDEEITFDASSSKPSEGASAIVGYLWEFDDGTEPVGMTSPICVHTYSADLLPAGTSERHFTVVLTVMDDLGRTDSTTLDLLVKRPPVLLVHGFQLTSFDLDDIWGDMAEYLTGQSVENDQQYDWICLGTGLCDPSDPGFDPDFAMKRLGGNGFTVYISCYTHYTCDGTGLDIETYAHCLADEIQLVRQEESVSQVDIVAHSMGGLVSRAYIEHRDLDGIQWYRNDIRKLIMLGTPNHGADIASLIPYIPGVPGDVIANWPSVQQMKLDSGFLAQLNSGVTGQDQTVEYSAVAGNFYRCGSMNPGCFPPTHYFCVTGALLCILFHDDNDGLVLVNSVKLGEIPELTGARFFVRDMNHTELCRLTGPIVRPILNAPSFSSQPIPVPDLQLGRLFSPGELRVYDSEGHITGLVDGQVIEDIPDSRYDDETNTVMVFSTNDSHHWEVVGTGEGTYGLQITYQHDGETTTFLAAAIPTTDRAIHQYSIDWDALSEGHEGVTVQIDSDADGEFDATLVSDGELTHDEFVLQTQTVIHFDPDTLNVKSKGQYLTGYIELPTGYDVSQIDVSTIRLSDTVPALAAPTAIGDYDSDDISDLMVKFDMGAVQAVVDVGDSVEITVTGEVAGIAFQGSDTIRVTNPRPWPHFPHVAI